MSEGQVDWIAENTRLRRENAGLRRDVGLARVERRAGDGWVEEAAAAIRDHARATMRAFLVEDVAAAWAAAKRPAPPDGRAWGAATQRAKREGWIQHVGYAAANSSNKSPKCTWLAA